jgi:ADP-ribose pyrophosphatase YjhB (NUDIX family)
MLVREEKVLLVKHTYQPGWYLPGGGVKWGETLSDAARREAWEEVGAKLDEIDFFGIYSTKSSAKTEHIAAFVCHSFTITDKPDYEIESWDFYPMNNLPEDISNGSRRRIKEYLQQKQPDAGLW